MYSGRADVSRRALAVPSNSTMISCRLNGEMFQKGQFSCKVVILNEKVWCFNKREANYVTINSAVSPENIVGK